MIGFLSAPLPQAVLTGALTLIPARKYPAWLRHSLVFGPVVAGTTGGLFLALTPQASSRLLDRFSGGTSQDSQTPGDHTDSSAEPSRAKVAQPVAALATGAALGAVASMSLAGAFWLDGAIEARLRRRNIPLPRTVMALGTGAITWWQLRQDNSDPTVPDRRPEALPRADTSGT